MACRNVGSIYGLVPCDLCDNPCALSYQQVTDDRYEDDRLGEIGFDESGSSFICPICEETCICDVCSGKRKPQRNVRDIVTLEGPFDTVIASHHANDKLSSDSGEDVEDKVALKPKRRRAMVEVSPPRKFRRGNPPPGATDLRIVRIQVEQTDKTNDEAFSGSSDDDTDSLMTATPPPRIGDVFHVQTVVPSGSVPPAILTDLMVTLPTMVPDPSWQTWTSTEPRLQNIENITEAVTRTSPWAELPFETLTGPST